MCVCVVCVCVCTCGVGGREGEVVISRCEKSGREGRGGERHEGKMKCKRGKQGEKDAQIEGELPCVLIAINATWIQIL